ncbi:uncharacterized protein LOC116618196 isoform X2 [Nematostella vectensis]|uniref:uncharacterized protein LOC116618196 isoform X2 n=1 Tax=Nematostella vectensis TaxID=45351 RepID=UPI002076D871|nr:uncharacterized protein LOC116618196 isoform X2 [Nematostella vectensis]
MAFSISACMPTVLKLVDDATALDSGNCFKEAYCQYLSCCEFISQILKDDAWEKDIHAVYSRDVAKLLRLIQLCQERALSIVSSQAPKSCSPPGSPQLDAQRKANSETSLSLQPPNYTNRKYSDPIPPRREGVAGPARTGIHTRNNSAGSISSNDSQAGVRPLQFPSPPSSPVISRRANAAMLEKHMVRDMYPGRETGSGLAEGYHGNQLFIQAYRTRTEQIGGLKRGPNRDTISKSLSMMRKMAENQEIARAREEALKKKKLERQQRLRAETDRRFAFSTLASREAQEQRVIYTQILEFEQETIWPKQLRQKLKNSPEDSNIINKIMQQIFSSKEHPLTRYLLQYQYLIYQKLGPLVRDDRFSYPASVTTRLADTSGRGQGDDTDGLADTPGTGQSGDTDGLADTPGIGQSGDTDGLADTPCTGQSGDTDGLADTPCTGQSGDTDGLADTPGTGQSGDTDGLADTPGTGQSGDTDGLADTPGTGQSNDTDDLVDTSGTGQSDDTDGLVDTSGTGQSDDTDGPVDTSGTGQSDDSDGPVDTSGTEQSDDTECPVDTPDTGQESDTELQADTTGIKQSMNRSLQNVRTQEGSHDIDKKSESDESSGIVDKADKNVMSFSSLEGKEELDEECGVEWKHQHCQVINSTNNRIVNDGEDVGFVEGDQGGTCQGGEKRFHLIGGGDVLEEKEVNGEVDHKNYFLPEGAELESISSGNEHKATNHHDDNDRNKVEKLVEEPESDQDKLDRLESFTVETESNHDKELMEKPGSDKLNRKTRGQLDSCKNSQDETELFEDIGMVEKPGLKKSTPDDESAILDGCENFAEEVVFNEHKESLDKSRLNEYNQDDESGDLKKSEDFSDRLPFNKSTHAANVDDTSDRGAHNPQLEDPEDAEEKRGKAVKTTDARLTKINSLDLDSDFLELEEEMLKWESSDDEDHDDGNIPAVFGDGDGREGEEQSSKKCATGISNSESTAEDPKVGPDSTSSEHRGRVCDSGYCADSKGLRSIESKRIEKENDGNHKEELTQEVSLEETRKQLKDIFVDIRFFLEKLQKLLILAYEELDTPTGHDQCYASVEHPFFRPLWPLLLAVLRRVNYEKEETLGYVMTKHIRDTPAGMSVTERLCMQDETALEATGNHYPYQLAVDELHKVVTYVCPLEKLECLVRTSRNICQCVEDYWECKGKPRHCSETSIGCDDLLPVLGYVIVRSGMAQLISECHAMEEFIPEGYLMGEEGYCLTTLQTALAYLITMDTSVQRT